MEDSHETHHENNEMRIDNNPDGKLEKVGKAGNNFFKNPWVIVSIILAVVVIILLIKSFGGVSTGVTVSGEDAGAKLVEFLNSRTGGGVEYLSFEELGGDLYAVTVSYNGQDIPVFITKDGEYFVQGAVPIDDAGVVPNNPQQPQQPVEVTKSDKPKVELFVMTHCPYGTQAEKGYLPAINKLGDKIDSSVKFVHYFLHDPENAETPVQICIREEQGDKFNDYLACFLEDGDSARCLTKTGIDQTKLDACIANNYDALYAVDSELSQGYGVQGSPTLVINGQIISSGRSSAAMLETICSAFNTAPEECDAVLSAENPSPGFGYSTSAAATNAQAQC